MKVNFEEEIEIPDADVIAARTGRSVRMAVRVSVTVITHDGLFLFNFYSVSHRVNQLKISSLDVTMKQMKKSAAGYLK